MLKVLISSSPARGGWLGSTAFSTVTHGALIALAVAGTTRTATQVQEERGVEPERITYVATRLLSTRDTRPASESKPAPPRPTPATVPNIAALQMQVEDQLTSVRIPDIAAADLTAVTDAWLAAADSLTTVGSDVTAKLLEQMAFRPPRDGIYTEDIVERSVQPRHGNPKPRYPSALQQMAIEGDFVVKFVVDSTGSVEDDKIEFPSSMHRLFADAVRSALRRSRYFPATFAGHTVPQLVVQEFRFTMSRRRW